TTCLTITLIKDSKGSMERCGLSPFNSLIKRLRPALREARQYSGSRSKFAQNDAATFDLSVLIIGPERSVMNVRRSVGSGSYSHVTKVGTGYPLSSSMSLLHRLVEYRKGR